MGFTLDQHYNHRRISVYCGRPFDGVRDMNRWLIEAHNAAVGDEDEVGILGDLAFRYPEFELPAIGASLRGRLYHVPGNHDGSIPVISITSVMPRSTRQPGSSSSPYKQTSLTIAGEEVRDRRRSISSFR